MDRLEAGLGGVAGRGLKKSEGDFVSAPNEAEQVSSCHYKANGTYVVSMYKESERDAFASHGNERCSSPRARGGGGRNRPNTT